MLEIKINLKEPKEEYSHFIEGRKAEILIEKEKIGDIGEIHPRILKNFKIKMPVSLFEINLDPIIEKIVKKE